MFQGETARFAAHLHHPLEGGVIDVHGELGQAAYGVGDSLFVSFGNQTETEPMGVDPGIGGQDSESKLLAAHLQAEYADFGPGLGGVDCHVDCQGALAHGWPSPQDNHVGPL